MMAMMNSMNCLEMFYKNKTLFTWVVWINHWSMFGRHYCMHINCKQIKEYILIGSGRLKCHSTHFSFFLSFFSFTTRRKHSKS